MYQRCLQQSNVLHVALVKRLLTFSLDLLDMNLYTSAQYCKVAEGYSYSIIVIHAPVLDGCVVELNNNLIVISDLTSNAMFVDTHKTPTHHKTVPVVGAIRRMIPVSAIAYSSERCMCANPHFYSR